MSWLDKFFLNAFKATAGEESTSPEGNATTSTPHTATTNEEDQKVVDEEFLLELEEKLLRIDCGLEFSEYLIQEVKKLKNATAGQAKKLIKQKCLELLENTRASKIPENGLLILLIIGVNGAGKTTSIGKLANKYVQAGKKVLIAPCDTFRAAAPEQLKHWTESAKATFYESQSSSKKPDALLYEALGFAKKENYDVLLVDTAGRLQNKTDLMDELAKLSLVIDKQNSGKHNVVERLLVLDGSIGQNGYLQAENFNKACKIDSLILTKIDGSAKAGIAFAITHNLKIPIRYLCTGEKIHQIEEFSAPNFVERIFG
jgi:fused signal recognition particle receptor